ncbi:endonuclease/exonuclease/phosphatase family protein [Pseudonocardia adelaidensis]|uniref:Endonuclease/exonuclease/phosphatase domain-containing protein n=1 Tax=Pseudonocardia adelaidensis TaxID=648754 RepID=A0ABP9NGK2_9PSEU
MVKVGTWNLENLFRPGPSGPSTDAAYTAKLEALAQAIGQLSPDVLAVQEVGDPDALKDLAALLDGYEHTATAAPDGRGIRVGFLPGRRSTRGGHAHIFGPPSGSGTGTRACARRARSPSSRLRRGPRTGRLNHVTSRPA